MKFVYIINSLSQVDRHYTGSTTDLGRRLEEHNTGKSIHTNKFKPWALETYIVFEDHDKADAFEAYLKSGSGRAFAKKRL